jgi:hypothetical protein
VARARKRKEQKEKYASIFIFKFIYCIKRLKDDLSVKDQVEIRLGLLLLIHLDE